MLGVLPPHRGLITVGISLLAFICIFMINEPMMKQWRQSSLPSRCVEKLRPKNPSCRPEFLLASNEPSPERYISSALDPYPAMPARLPRELYWIAVCCLNDSRVSCVFIAPSSGTRGIYGPREGLL